MYKLTMKISNLNEVNQHFKIKQTKRHRCRAFMFICDILRQAYKNN